MRSPHHSTNPSEQRLGPPALRTWRLVPAWRLRRRAAAAPAAGGPGLEGRLGWAVLWGGGGGERRQTAGSSTAARGVPSGLESDQNHCGSQSAARQARFARREAASRALAASAGPPGSPNRHSDVPECTLACRPTLAAAGPSTGANTAALICLALVDKLEHSMRLCEAIHGGSRAVGQACTAVRCAAAALAPRGPAAICRRLRLSKR